jgi:hypothetical protein
MILRLDNQALHIDYPSAGQHIDAPLDGVEAAVRGPHAPEGTTRAVRPAGNREFLVVTKHHGKVFTQGSLKLGNDGRVITESFPFLQFTTSQTAVSHLSSEIGESSKTLCVSRLPAI